MRANGTHVPVPALQQHRLPGRTRFGPTAALTLLLALVLSLTSLAATSSAATYPYSVTTTTESPWVGSTPVTFTGRLATVQLPWSFTIYGHTYSSVTIGQYGTLQFGTNYANSADSCLPSPHFTAPTILPLWTQLAMTDQGEGAWTRSLHRDDYGDMFIVQWTGHVVTYPSPRISFAVALIRSTNEIQITYGDGIPSQYLSASTIGITPGDYATPSINYSCWAGTTQSIPENTVVTFTPQVPALVNNQHAATTGNPEVGQVLSVSTGTWAPTPDSYSYRWERCTSLDINSCSYATDWSSSNQYTLQSGDYGKYLVAVVQASNGWGPGIYSDLAFPYGPIKYVTNLTQPAFGGTAAVGSTLTKSSDGTWRPTPTGYHYQWARCKSTCSNIAGATNAGYTIVAADVGYRVYLQVQAYDSYGSSSWVASSNLSDVVPGTPANTSHPVVSGSPAVGTMLSTTNGSWNPTPDSYEYKWVEERNDLWYTIAGATASTYTVTLGDVGYTIYPVVRAHDSAGWSDWIGSDSGIGPIPAPSVPVNTAAPQVSGTTMVGATLTSTQGTWSDSPDQYGYEWWHCKASSCTPSQIAGASGATYVIASTEVGNLVWSRVSAHNGGGWSTPKSSNAVGPIVAGGGGSSDTGGTSDIGGTKTGAGGQNDTGDEGDADHEGGTRTSDRTTKPTALKIQSLTLTPSIFRAVRSGGSVGTKGGTRVTFLVNRSAYLEFTVQRVLPGRLAAGRCMPIKPSSRGSRACTRYTLVRGKFGYPAHGLAPPVRTSFRFTGRIGSATLTPGTYRLTAVAEDAAHIHSTAVRVNFRINR